MPFCLECKVGYNRDKSTGTCQQCKKWEYFDNTLEICKICHVNNC